jgi:hypothetical protein
LPQFPLFSDQKQNAGYQRQNRHDELDLGESYSEADQTLKDEVDSEEKSADAFGEFHEGMTGVMS